MTSEYDIRPVPMYIRSEKSRVDALLARNGLRYEPVDTFYGVYDCDDELLGGGGLDAGNGIIKCVALDDSLRGSGVANALISRLRSEASLRGIANVRVFTKPEYADMFSSLAFKKIGESREAVMLESSPRQLREYCDALSRHRRDGRCGVIVMNCNPFTYGHRYLIEEAARQVDHLFTLCVSEDRSDYPLRSRLAMLREMESDRVTVLETGPYAISSATFPSYFLKRIDDATDAHIRLDLDIFCRHIAPALGATVRFAGSEPLDPLTARYNALMAEILPAKGLEFIEIPRLEKSGEPVSASRLRDLLSRRRLREALSLTPADPRFILCRQAHKALVAELDLTPKPGLVDRNNSGAHTDMDYDLMRRSADAVAQALFDIIAPGELPDVAAGIEAERLMLQATGGVNTHKGAIFAFGLILFCINKLLYTTKEDITPSLLSDEIASTARRLAALHRLDSASHGSEVRRQYGVKGAMDMALEGYKPLFESWLPFLRRHRDEESVLHRLLLKIISELDDTNVYHRGGEEGARWLKSEAARLLDDYSEEALARLDRECIDRNLSPGGCADMLALTILTDSLLTDNINNNTKYLNHDRTH